MKEKALFTIALAVIFVTALTAAGLSAAAGGEEIELKIAIHSDENTLTPFTYVRGTGLEVLRLIYDSLFIFDALNQPLPWMVSDYGVEKGHTVYHLTLLPDQFWHDGAALTADDVAFSFTYPLSQPHARWQRMAAMIESVEVTGELTLTIRLKKGNPDFIPLVLADLPIIPRHIYEGEKDAKLVRGTIGSGPYRLAEYKEGQYYILEAVAGYFRGKPLVERIVLPIITDRAAIFQALRAGSLDAATANLPPELVGEFEAVEEINIASGPGLATTLLQFNNEFYPFNLPEMRKAVALALDLQELVNIILLGFGDPGSLGFFHPAGFLGSAAFVPERNLDRSNELLDGLGFLRRGDIRVDDQGRPLSFDLLTQADNPLRIRTAELIARQLSAVGIEIEVVSMESNTLDDRVWPEFDVSQGRNYALTLWGWSAPLQLRSEALVQLFASAYDQGSFNIGGFADDEFDLLAERLANEIDQDRRRLIIDEMQRLIAEKIPMIPLYYQQVIMAYRPAAYDGYILQQGSGIINKMSFLPGFTRESAWREADNNEPKRSNITAYILTAVLIVVVIAVVKASRRGKSHAD